jgi:diacylglycerol kinase (ATP)
MQNFSFEDSSNENTSTLNSSPAEEAPKIATPFKRIHLIVNPAAGQDEPILKTINTAFQMMEVEWEMFVTKQAGDAQRYASEAVATGVDLVAVYGGDGTVLEAANGVYLSNTPLAILPGGTANVLAVELGIPRDLNGALALLARGAHLIRPIDMGKVDGNLFFHMGIGLEGNVVQRADRAAKDQSGMLAYITSALAELQNPPVAHYRMILDGELVEVDGVDCMITTYGSIGIGGLKVSHAIDASDGLLDVIVIQDVNLPTLLTALAGALTTGEIAQPLLQWQVRKAEISTDPPQTVVCDGELTEIQQIHVQVVPQAIQVVTPIPPEQSSVTPLPVYA